MNRLYVIFTILFIITTSCKRKCPNCADIPSPATSGTITFQDKKYIMDSYVANTNATVNYGTDTKIYTSAWTYSGGNVEIYLLLKFDYSSIPTSATITSAKLTLYADTSTNISVNQLPGIPPGHYGNGSNNSVLSNITSTWDESTVTWNTVPTFTTSNQLMINPTATSSDSVYVDVTSLIMDQRKNGNYGFQLELQNFLLIKGFYFIRLK